MKLSSVTILILLSVLLSSCTQERPIPDGFTCVKPFSADSLPQRLRAPDDYDHLQDGKLVPKGWIEVPDGPYKGCYTPYSSHNGRSTVAR